MNTDYLVLVNEDNALPENYEKNIKLVSYISELGEKFIIEEIKQSIPNQIKYLKQQANQEMINYKKSIDEIAKGIKRAQEQLKEQSQQVKNLKLNNILDNDFSALFPAPVTLLPRRPLSNRASTASCNIRFSF